MKSRLSSAFALATLLIIAALDPTSHTSIARAAPAAPRLIRSSPFIDGFGKLALWFCGTDIHQDLHVKSWRDGRNFGTRAMRVDFGGSEQCTVAYDLADGGVLWNTTYHTGVALNSNDPGNVCSSDQGLCDNVTSRGSKPTLIRSALSIDSNNDLSLQFCGKNLRQNVFVHAWREGPDFGLRPVWVDWGSDEGCVTAGDLDGPGPVNASTVYHTGVALNPGEAGNVCSSLRGLCDNVTSGTSSTGDEVIVDDADTGFTASGGWTASSSWSRHCQGNHGDARWTLSRSPPDTNDADWARWTPNLPTAGDYEVYILVPGIQNGKSDTQSARYKIHHATGETSIQRSQRNNWCNWVSLGTFGFNAGTGGNVYLGDYTGGESPQTGLVADAVKFVRRSTAVPSPARTTVDDGNDGFSASPGWSIVSGNGSRGCAGESGDARWTYSRKPGSNTDVDWSKWTAQLPQAGRYEVKFFVPGIQNKLADTQNARYIVHHKHGETPVIRSQANAWCNWVSLGTFEFDAGDQAWVTLGDYTGESPQKSVVADAVQWVYVNAQADTVPPTGHLISPANNSTLTSRAVEISAEAGDAESSLDHVDFWVKYNNGWHQVGSSHAAPYQLRWSVPADVAQQQLIFSLHVFDRAGNETIDPGGYHDAQFTPARLDIAGVARAEIGMLYSQGDRGLGQGVYGPWQAKTGACTDLVIDAYVGAGLALWESNPKEFSRSATQMRRWFKANQTLLDDGATSGTWQVGDMEVVSKVMKC